MIKRISTIMICLLVSASFYSCRETTQDKAEEAVEAIGEDMENAMEDAGDAIEDAAEKTGEALEDAAQEIEEEIEGTDDMNGDDDA